ncbi:NAD(P)-dependent oxidoreductase [Leptolyngbya sp. 7M]|uniref:NAD(P)-dependent oxidoreductase n=1 Tax=Leptolyngbya sp. 7M TaxID=2812896 RepID=UPI001B8C9712|nr:NAD(P)-dependent oxidoreductase [Leptolyngbya sp. 7M]QYO62526.1 glycosyltransferase [Leptolyngbya sp. 7M]
MVRVAFVAGTYQSQHCGVAHYTAHLRQVLSARGIESLILTTREAANQLTDPTVQGAVNCWHLSELLALAQAIIESKVDCLHIQHAAGTYGFDRAIFLLPLLLRLRGWRLPIVTTVHEYGWWEWRPAYLPSPLLEWLKTWGQRRGWWDREDGFLLTYSDAIITTNQQAEQIIYQRLPHLKSVTHRIPIAANVETALLDRSTARQMVQQAYGWFGEVAIIAFFSFLHPVKGLETLLPAFQQVVAAYPQARLLLIGGVESLALPGAQADRYWEQLKALVAELGLTEVVQMTGYSDQVSVYLRAADLGVLPFHAGITLKSGSLLAMMAHGLPIVATRSNPPDPDLTDKSLLKLVSPRDAVLINTARGSIVDPIALYRALSEGKIAAAAIDVTEPEPIPSDSPLLTLENLIITPHIASASRQTRTKMATMAIENLVAGLQGNRLPHCVNPEVYS